MTPCERISRPQGAREFTPIDDFDATVRHGAPTEEADIGYQEKILLGRFVDRQSPTWHERNTAQHQKKLGDKYRPQKVGVEA